MNLTRYHITKGDFNTINFSCDFTLSHTHTPHTTHTRSRWNKNKIRFAWLFRHMAPGIVWHNRATQTKGRQQQQQQREKNVRTLAATMYVVCVCVNRFVLCSLSLAPCGTIPNLSDTLIREFLPSTSCHKESNCIQFKLVRNVLHFFLLRSSESNSEYSLCVCDTCDFASWRRIFSNVDIITSHSP